MHCRSCKSSNTRVSNTEHRGRETWRYIRCLDCDTRFKTIETYAEPKRGSAPGAPVHPNQIKRGEKHPNAVLTDQNVLDMRQHAEENKTYNWISQYYGVHKDTVYRIVNRKTWTHI